MAFLVCETPMVIVMAGDARIDNAKYKARFAKKAKMPTPDEVLTLIGHPVGGVALLLCREVPTCCILFL